jgi:hypothetical protein
MQEDDKIETDTMDITKLIKFVNFFIAYGKKELYIKGNIMSKGQYLPIVRHASKIYCDTTDDGKVHKLDEFYYYTPSSEH